MYLWFHPEDACYSNLMLVCFMTHISDRHDICLCPLLYTRGRGKGNVERCIWHLCRSRAPRKRRVETSWKWISATRGLCPADGWVLHKRGELSPSQGFAAVTWPVTKQRDEWRVQGRAAYEVGAVRLAEDYAAHTAGCKKKKTRKNKNRLNKSLWLRIVHLH